MALRGVDYPDYGYKLAEHIANGRAERGVALCGSGGRHRHCGQSPCGLPLRPGQRTRLRHA
ncbi:RpiB/LacA/LacB family sugar-phosphate isomerase [Caulobacter sp. DWP3-1-3b2]|uniref:RpiB/LacA/LacB family sugar-phosphate isomerase n=1 Tax=Caulobacter sp. DWP3-1-3b2 TaxID=2804643 RepID=UPI003CF19077